MNSMVTKEMEDILSSVSSTEELYNLLINSSKSRDFKTISKCDDKKYLVKIGISIREGCQNE